MPDFDAIIPDAAETTPLGLAQRGFSGRVSAIMVDGDHLGVSAVEIERRLLELGIVEGASVQILHEGPIGRDPIAVRVNGTTIALRRREAMAIMVGAPERAAKTTA
ncbi:FeoA family protein [Nitrobacter sp.]|uniref:FeoA family protein n=1 Tax=Nitrobacter sp. TaxID=29420 RepID=UPI0029CAB290|nr:FeoA family protein [Nitrobacter sp.]